MADKEIAMLPRTDIINDNTILPVYNPDSLEPAQHATGAQFRSFAKEGGAEAMETVGRPLAEAAAASAAAAALSAKQAADQANALGVKEDPNIAFAVVSETTGKPALLILNDGTTKIPNLKLPDDADFQTVTVSEDTLKRTDKFDFAIADEKGRTNFYVKDGVLYCVGIKAMDTDNDSSKNIAVRSLTISEDVVEHSDKYDFVLSDESGRTNFYVKNGVLHCAGIEAKNIKADNLVNQIKRRIGQYRNDNFDAEINMFICYGQSWACGYDARVISSEQRYDSLMLDTGIMDEYIKIPEENNPADFTYRSDATSFLPLVEQQREESAGSGNAGETPVTGQTDMVKQLIRDENGYGINDLCYQMLGTAPGRGSAKINQLKKGTVYYKRLIGQVEKANEIAKQMNKRLVVQAFSWVQGKTDDTSTPYYQQLEQLRSDIDADVKAITNQTNDVKCITWGGFGTSDSVNESREVYERYVYPSELYENIVCAGAQYHLTNVAAKNLHLTSESNELMGAQFGIAYKRTILDAEKFVPMKPIKFVKSGNTLRVQFAVPQMPVVIDTDTITERANYGFRIFDAAGNEKTIRSVSVVSPDTVKIVCAAAVDSTDFLTYANNQGTSVWQHPSDCSGNLRDSQGDFITYETHNNIKHRMYNWCVPFGKTISELEE